MSPPAGPPMADTPFADLSARRQQARLRPAALEVLRHWPIEVANVRLLMHGYNTTYRVDTAAGERFALRLDVNHRKPVEELRAEMAWLSALAHDTDLVLPVPQLTVDGGHTAAVFVPAVGANLEAALFSWLPGTDLSRRATPHMLGELGRVMAALHTHAERWQLPPGASLPSADRYWAPGHPLFVSGHHELTPQRVELFRSVAARVSDVHAQLAATAAPIVLHADLHLANAKWHRGRLAVFDFDDALVGVRAHDLAISTYYLRPRTELIDALFEGYAAVRPLPALRDDQLEVLLAARNLLLAHELTSTDSGDFRALLPQFMINSEIRCRHFLATGEFRHDLPGVVALW